MSACIFNDGFPATGRGGEYADRCWRHTPEEQDSYPVLVTYTSRHVVWVPAEDQETAVENMQSEPYEKTDDQETLASCDWEVKAPKAWDRYLVQDGDYYMPYQGLRCNAHVELYRAHQRELARAAEAVLVA